MKIRALVSIWFLIGLVISARGAEGVRINGMVMSRVDGSPLAGAVARFDLDPADGVAEVEVKSDTFGYFKVPALPAGTYRLSVERMGFVTEEAEFVAAGEAMNHVVRLAPVAGKVVLDLWAQVNCLATAAPLAGGRVTAEYWPLENPNGAPAIVFPGNLDSEGSVRFTALPEGYYRLRAERAGWEPMYYTPPPDTDLIVLGDKVRLQRSFFASVYLKPVKQDLSVTVRGFDPVKNEADQPLMGMVIHLTGLDLSDDTVVVPTISALSREDGSYVFRNRAPVRWRVEVARLGYETAEHIFTPRGDGTFEAATVNVTLGPTKLKVIASSVYRTTQATAGAKIEIEGLVETGTEGIKRELNTTVGAAGFETAAVFENLLPGRYVVRSTHEATMNDFPNRSGPIVVFNSVKAVFAPVESYAEAELFQTSETRLNFEAVPSRIRGRLFASDKLADADEVLAAAANLQKPVYQSKTAQGITFVQAKIAELLPAGMDRVVVDTDEAGYFTAILPPGMWGVQIPGLTTHTGYSIESGVVSEGFGLFARGWPYADVWPYATYDSARHGPPLGFNSGEETQMNLFTHRNYANLCGFVLNPMGDPFRNFVLAGAASETPITYNYNHFYDTRQSVTAVGPVTREAAVLADGSYLVEDVPQGTYSLNLNAPGYSTPVRNVTVAPWLAPGVLPPVAPTDATYWTAGIASSKLLLNLQPTWEASGSIRINKKVYMVPAEGAPYYATIGQDAPEYFSTDALPGRLFSYVPGGVPPGTWTVYLRHGGAWFKWVGTGAPTLDAYEGGPQDNTNMDNAPDAGVYTVDLHAYSRADRLFDLSNITVTFASGEQRVAGGTVTISGAPQVTAAADPEGLWSLRASATEVKLIDVENRIVRINVYLERSMRVSGLITSSAGGIVPVAGFTLRDRYGATKGGSLVTQDGTFNAQFVQPQTLFLEIQARGFLTKRIFLGEPDPQNPDRSGLVVTLDPVPAPRITEFTMNRFGLFLPGVLRSSDPNGLLNAEVAAETLRVTWKGAGVGQRYRVTLPGFFDENNVQRPDEVVDVQDRISEMYLVDRRAFEKPFINEADQARYTPNLPPSPLDYLSATRWLKDVQRGVRNNLPFYVAHQLQVAKAADGERVEGKLNLWELPSGVFRPMLVAVTKAGGVAVVDYELPAGDSPSLQGLALSPVAAGVLDAVGVIANFPSFEKHVFESHGNGVVKAGTVGGGVGRPEVRIFRDPIDSEPEDDVCLTYKYAVGVNMSFGEGSVGKDAMSFGPSFLGLKPSGVTLEFEVAGRDKKVSFAPVFSAATPAEVEERDKNYRPVIAADEPLDNGNEFNASIEMSGKVGGSITLDKDWLGNNRVSAFAVQAEAQGKLDLDARYNITKKLPVIGPYLAVADELDLARVYAVFEATMGSKAALTIETRFPDPSGTVTTAEHERFDMFGTTTEMEFKAFLRLAVGAQLTLGRDSVKVTALAQVGAPASTPDIDGVVFTVNPMRTRGYLIEKVEGALSLVLRGELELWTMKMKKQWQWDREFVIDRASVPRFDLEDLNITQTIVQPGGTPPQRFVGTGENLAKDFYAKGSVAVTGGENPLLVMSGVDAEGRMTVMVSGRGTDRWNAPVTIATAGGVVSLDAARLPDGRGLVVWSEIAAADVLNPFAAMTMKYSVSDANGQNWSAAATLRTESGAMHGIRLAQAGELTVLVFQSSAEGRDGPSTIRSAVFDGQAWTEAARLAGPAEFRSFAVAGSSSGSAIAAFSTRDGMVRSVFFDRGTWTTLTEIASNAAGAVAAHISATDRILIAWVSDADQVQAVSRSRGDAEWRQLGAVVGSALGAEMAVTTLRRGEEDSFLLAWTSGADKNSIFYSVFDHLGAVALDATEVTVRSQGFYDRLRLRNVGADRAAIVAVYTEGEETMLREFVVGLPANGDCDGDGMLDATAISLGLVRDCNNNGIPDFCEIRQGATADLNRNGIPDSCEAPTPDDCNLNGVSDRYELSLGIGDEDNDGVLDVCEALISVRTVPLPTDVRQRYYRAPQLQIRSRTATTLELQFQGALEQTDDLRQPFRRAD